MAPTAGETAAAAGPVALGGRPLIGHLSEYRRDPLGLLDRCAAAPGSVAELRIRTRTYVLKRAEDVRHVLVSNAGTYEKTARAVGARAGRLGGRGVFFQPADAEHRRARSLLRPPLGREAVPRLDADVVASADRAIESWPEGQAIDLEREATALAFRSLLKGIFGAFPEDSPALADGLMVRRHYFERSVRSLLPHPRFLPVSLSPARRRALIRFDQELYSRLARERAAEEPPASLLADFGRATTSNGDGQPSDRQIRDQLLTLGITGFVNVGLGMTWTLYELARNPHVAARLEAELDGALAGRAPTAEDARRLPYTGMCISEALRLYPPSWVFLRIPGAYDELPSGPTLRAGAKVLVSPYLVQRSAAYYQQPQCFDPDRMAPAKVAERPRIAYFPFGAGHRVCVGRDFGLLQQTLTIARIAQRVRFELLSGDAELRPHVSLQPRQAIELRVTKR